MNISTFLLGTANGIALVSLIGSPPEWSGLGLAILAGLMMMVDTLTEPAEL